MRAMNRRGFSTVELTVAITMAGIIAASLGTVLRRQQRFFTGATAVVERRASLRDATAILQTELRALSPAGGDVLAYSDSALEIRSTIGAAVACDTLPGGGGVDLLASGTSSAVPLAGFSTSPQPGDIALVFDPGPAATDSDDSWVAADVSGTATVTTSCLTSPLLESAGEPATNRLRLRFDGARLPPTVRPGAFVRVLRRVRYRLYRSSTGEWYLGYSEWDGATFGVVQPVTGPFASYSSRAGSSGIALRYFDDVGTQLTLPSDVARIARVEVVARAAPGAGLSQSDRPVGDSQAVTIRVRNR